MPQTNHQPTGVLNTAQMEFEAGWCLSHLSEEYEFVSWGDEIPNISGKKKDVPNHQPGRDFQTDLMGVFQGDFKWDVTGPRQNMACLSRRVDLTPS